MEKVINYIIINKEKTIVFSFMLVLLSIMGLYIIYSIDTTFSIEGGTPSDSYYQAFDITFTDNTERKQVVILPGHNKLFDIVVNNEYEKDIAYAITYKMISPVGSLPAGVRVAKNSRSIDAPKGAVSSKTPKTVSLIILNNSSSQVTIEISIKTGYVNGGEVIKNSDEVFITDVYDVLG